MCKVRHWTTTNLYGKERKEKESTWEVVDINSSSSSPNGLYLHGGAVEVVVAVVVVVLVVII